MAIRRSALNMSATCCAFVLSAAAVLAQDNAGGAYAPPMTSWGEPDISGTWPVAHLNGTPLQRPEQFGEREFLTDEEYAERVARLEAQGDAYAAEDSNNAMGMGHWREAGDAPRRTSLIVSPANGRLPAFTPEGERRKAEMRSSWMDITWDWVTDFDTWDRCITRGMPASMFPFQYNNGMRIFQSPGMVAINMEMVHETRMIPTDGRAAVPAAIQNWMGESRGHWEGNTLVVETTNLKPGPSATNIGTTGSPPNNNTPISEEARIVERFIPTGDGTMTYEMTYTDPVIFTEPWTARADWVQDDEYGMFEYACHEANYMIRDYINASRAARMADAGGGAAE